jgi:hypothetical protein
VSTQLLITYKEPIVKVIEKWTSRDFIKYYFNSLQKFDGSNPPKIPVEAWIGFGARIKGFQRKLSLSNHQYKHFIDTVFRHFYTGQGYEPVFGCIVSEKIYHLTQKVKSSEEFSNEEFMRLKEELYRDESLFKKMQLKLSDE